MSAVAKELVGHGYEVTTVFYAKTKIVHENYNEIFIEDKMAEMYNKFSKLIMETGGSITSPRLWIEAINVWKDMGSFCIDSLLENPKLVKLMDDKVKVDAVIAMTGCGIF